MAFKQNREVCFSKSVMLIAVFVLSQMWGYQLNKVKLDNYNNLIARIQQRMFACVDARKLLTFNYFFICIEKSILRFKIVC